MSRKDDTEMGSLREEVKILREQLLRISERIEETEEAEEAPKDDEGEEAPEAPEEEPLEEETEDEWFDEDEPYYGRRRPRKRVMVGGPFLGEDFGDRLGDYIGGFVEDVMEGVTSELERSLFWEDRPERERPTVMSDAEVQRTADVMSALGNEHRIKILKELTWGGLYASDLQDVLKEISASTLSSHLDVLQEAGLIVQERRRGRYLITMSGRLAIKMASSIAKRVKTRVDPGGYI